MGCCGGVLSGWSLFTGVWSLLFVGVSLRTLPLCLFVVTDPSGRRTVFVCWYLFPLLWKIVDWPVTTGSSPKRLFKVWEDEMNDVWVPGAPGCGKLKVGWGKGKFWNPGNPGAWRINRSGNGLKI